MRPWQHARSSSAKERHWSADLAIHEFLDSTKASCADRRHRLVLHHVDLGAELAERAFPDRPDIRGIVERHVREDLKVSCTLADWFRHCDLARVPAPQRRRMAIGKAGIVNLVCGRLDPVCRPVVEAVTELMFLPPRYVPEHPEKSLAVLMNAASPAIVRQVFGPPMELSAGNRRVMADPAWIAEAVIVTTYGRIPDLGEVVRCWTAEPGAPDRG